jgi:tetratricopeptide (TPR) repeat protein
MLERVAERVRDASMLITFNGKSFDMPLLRTRFAMARMHAPVEPPHLDLLHMARRIHRRAGKDGRGAGACKLTAIERSVLGFERHDDVPSGEVSACYLHFLRTGDTRAMLGVIDHNAWDVVAMAALVGLYGEPFGDDAPERAITPLLAAEDLAGIARTLKRAGAMDEAMRAADLAVARDAAPEALRARAEIAKARGDRQRALVDLESVVDTIDDPRVRLELAKLYEHFVKEPSRALAMIERGVKERDPERRKVRLEKKLQKLQKAAQETLFGKRSR